MVELNSGPPKTNVSSDHSANIYGIISLAHLRFVQIFLNYWNAINVMVEKLFSPDVGLFIREKVHMGHIKWTLKVAQNKAVICHTL